MTGKTSMDCYVFSLKDITAGIKPVKHCFIFLVLLVSIGSARSSANGLPDHHFDFIDFTSASENNIKPPFQGKKVFCSTDTDTKYFITIKGNNVLIVTDNKKIKGVYKKDKLLTNDPDEIEHRKFTKRNIGKYYVIGKDYFSILNTENSEYRYFSLCK